jgi:hypothetical protein
MGKSWENHEKIIGNLEENHEKIMRKNHEKIIGKSWEHLWEHV